MKPRSPILLRKTYQKKKLTSYSGSFRTESARLSDVRRYVRQYVSISIPCERSFLKVGLSLLLVRKNNYY